MAALTKCKACGNQVSKNAKSCPSCGEPVKKERSSGGCGSVLVVVILVFVFVGIFTDRDTSNSTGGSGQQSSVPPTAEELRKTRIEKQFSAWDGAHIGLERIVESNLKDPDSYEHIKTTYRDNGDEILVSMNYRAKNSFGGYVVNRVIAVYDLSGKLVKGLFDCNETPDAGLCQ